MTGDLLVERRGSNAAIDECKVLADNMPKIDRNVPLSHRAFHRVREMTYFYLNTPSEVMLGTGNGLNHGALG